MFFYVYVDSDLAPYQSQPVLCSIFVSSQVLGWGTRPSLALSLQFINFSKVPGSSTAACNAMSVNKRLTAVPDSVENTKVNGMSTHFICGSMEWLSFWIGSTSPVDDVFSFLWCYLLVFILIWVLAFISMKASAPVPSRPILMEMEAAYLKATLVSAMLTDVARQQDKYVERGGEDEFAASSAE